MSAVRLLCLFFRVCFIRLFLFWFALFIRISLTEFFSIAFIRYRLVRLFIFFSFASNWANHLFTFFLLISIFIPLKINLFRLLIDIALAFHSILICVHNSQSHLIPQRFCDKSNTVRIDECRGGVLPLTTRGWCWSMMMKMVCVVAVACRSKYSFTAFSNQS